MCWCLLWIGKCSVNFVDTNLLSCSFLSTLFTFRLFHTTAVTSTISSNYHRKQDRTASVPYNTWPHLNTSLVFLLFDGHSSTSWGARKLINPQRLLTFLSQTATTSDKLIKLAEKNRRYFGHLPCSEQVGWKVKYVVFSY